MRIFVRILGFVIAVLLAVFVAVGFWVQDANRLKPELKNLIAENSDYTAQFNGDISWSLFPPLHLQAANVVLTHAEETISIAELDLKMDLSAMWEDITQWRVTELRLRDTERRQSGMVTAVRTLDILDFQPGRPSDFFLDISHRSDPDRPAMDAKLKGQFNYQAATSSQNQRLALLDTHIESLAATGICQADLSQASGNKTKAPISTDADLLPLETLRDYDFSVDCALSRLSLGDETFHQTQLEMTNIAGQINALLDIKDFLGGTLLVDVDIDTRSQPVLWTIMPDLQNVDSQRLLDWTKQRLQWIAAIAANSKIILRGNSQAELMASLEASSEFNGGQGQLNISKIKAQLMQVALLARKDEDVSSWPDIWNYEEFSGRWNVKGPAHNLKFAIDNMSVDADGTYDYLSDQLNMLANVTIHPAPEGNPFRINPLLEGTPIPVRCSGPSADPKCQLDQAAAQKLVARALQRGDDSGLRRKLEQKIDEDVPEEYRETARGILDLLGRALEGD